MKVKEKVVLGISGGVDSSVAAYILKQQGYEVIGVFLELGHPIPQHLDELMKRIQIKWTTFPITPPFSKSVIEKTLQMYKNGLTPNPCSICNRDAKMWGLYMAMKELGASFMATGHYSSVFYKTPYNVPLLKKNFDNPKDQTYFLALIDKKIIGHLILPLSGLEKPDIYNIASKIGILDIIGKKESQDICFSKKMSDFLKGHLGEKPGDIILYPDNIVIGKHRGSHLYTVGERLGAHPKTRDRLYVIKKENNTLYVALRKYLMHKTIKIFEKNSFIDNIDGSQNNLLLQTRYRGPLVEVDKIKNNIIIVKESIEATPGQIAAIFTNEGYLIMGGIIEGGK